MTAKETRSNVHLEALAYINDEKKGYISKLIERIGQKCVEEFVSVGFIICGYTRTAKTWRISKFGKEFYSEVQ